MSPQSSRQSNQSESGGSAKNTRDEGRTAWVRKWVVACAVAAPLVVAACRADVGAAGVVAPVVTDSARRYEPTNAVLTPTLANLNQCDAGPSVRDAANRFVRWDPHRSAVSVTYTAADTGVARYRVLHFDASGREDFDAVCILRQGTTAAGFMQRFFAPPASQLATPAFPGWASITEGDVCYYVGSQEDEVDCNGEHCYMYQARPLRTGPGNLAATNDVARYPGTPSRMLGDIFYCAGGGTLFDRGNGTAFFNPTGGDPPVDWDPPTPDGGACGTSAAPAAPGDTNPDGSPKLPEMRWANSCTVAPPPLTEAEFEICMAATSVDASDFEFSDSTVILPEVSSTFVATIAKCIARGYHVVGSAAMHAKAVVAFTALLSGVCTTDPDVVGYNLCWSLGGHFMSGSNDAYVLSSSEFALVASHAASYDPIEPTTSFTYNGQTYTKKKITMSSAMPIGAALGTFSLVLDSGGNVVGMYDVYDYDIHPRAGAGASTATYIANFLIGGGGFQSFQVSYGIPLPPSLR